ncbi:acyltransferase [Granulicella sp. 5B5]|nr:acyltransferase [Granulicella sp. 5B5]
MVYLFFGVRFRKFGKHSKLFGSDTVTVGTGVTVGDFCWIEAVTQYAGVSFTPNLTIGNRVAISDLTHISCVNKIILGDDCLIGSKVYIGDHSHGSVRDIEEILTVPPARRPLGDVGQISVGAMTWICDGVVILAGTEIAKSSIIAANSVVRLRESRPALIGGAPAKVIRYLDGNE